MLPRNDSLKVLNIYFVITEIENCILSLDYLRNIAFIV